MWIENIFDHGRTHPGNLFFYLPNFCVAETFSVFMKHSFGAWNSHVKKKGTIDTRVYKSLVSTSRLHEALRRSADHAS